MKNNKATTISLIAPTLFKINKFRFEPWMENKAARYYPLGLLSIATYLYHKNNDVDISIFDVNVELPLLFRSRPYHENNVLQVHDEMVKRFLLKKRPEIIGISGLFHKTKNQVHRIAGLAKKVLPESVVVLGGCYPSTSPQVAIKDNNVDFIVVGEGETRFEKLLHFLQGKISENDLEGIHSSKPEIHWYPSLKSYISLKVLPPYKLSLIKIDEYLTYSSFLSDSYLKSNRVCLQLYASRGCPNKCTYCTSGTANYIGPYRPLNSDILIEHIKIYKGLGVQELLFWDDNPCGSPIQIKKLMRALNNDGIPYTFANMELDAIDDEILQLYFENRESKTFQVGIESGSDEVLINILRRKLTKSEIMKKMVSIRSFVGKEAFLRATFMIGIPGETKEQIHETVNFALTLPIDWAVFSCFMPIPGTSLYETAIAKGYLKIDEVNLNYDEPIMDMPHLAVKEILYLRKYANYRVNFVENKQIMANPEKTIEAFRFVLSNYPGHCLAYWGISQCYKELGNASAYKTNLEEAVKISKQPQWEQFMEPLFNNKIDDRLDQF